MPRPARDPESPIFEGHLCSKGAASHELLTHAARATTVTYRAPHATDWQKIDPSTVSHRRDEIQKLVDKLVAERGEACVFMRDRNP